MSQFSKEKLRKILSCKTCKTLMKPPMCLCSNGHIVCRQCWDSRDCCPKCRVFYRVPIDSDGIEQDLECPHNHKSNFCDTYYDDDGRFCRTNLHEVLGNGEPCETSCYFHPNEKLYPVGGELITEQDYLSRCASVKPITNAVLNDFLRMGISLLEEKSALRAPPPPCAKCSTEKALTKSSAAKPVPVPTKQEAWISNLECSICMDIMTPPIMLCPTGHSVCEKCFEKVNNCPQCKVSYGKMVPDEFNGHKIFIYRCPKGCTFSNGSTNSHIVNGKEQVYLFTCTTCKLSDSLLAFKGVLMPISEYESLRTSHKPQRNFNLEAIVELVEYSCEFEGCDVKLNQNEISKHKMDCKMRPVDCPLSRCMWTGPVHLFCFHIRTAADLHGSVVQLDEKQMGTINICFQLPLQADRQPKLIFVIFKSSVFAVKIFIDDRERLTITVQHYGSKKGSEGFNVEMCLRSGLHAHKELKYQLNPGNDLDELAELDEIVLPSLAKLTNSGYVGDDRKLKIDIRILEHDTNNKLETQSAKRVQWADQ